MTFLNVEIKARYDDPAFARKYFLARHAEFKGVDFQVDTYFKVTNGRLKLREGNIENNLIYYQRENISGPKNSDFTLIKIDDVVGLKDALTKAIGVKIIVEKKREIYYIENVKFHLDEVDSLGCFIEIEAGNILADYSADELRKQCEFYMKELIVKESDLVDMSYSDMLLEVK